MKPVAAIALSCVRSLVLSSLAVVMLCGTGLAQAPRSPQETTLRQMFDAVQSGSYERFTAEGDARFKAGFTSKMFDTLAGQLGPRLKLGYELTFLTTLNQQEHVGFVWKLSFKGVKDDFLATLFIKEGKVSGFIVR